MIRLAILLVVLSFMDQSSTQPDLSKLEAAVANQFNDLRVKSALKPLKFRDDIRLRMEACAVAVRGPDPKVQQLNVGRKSWYTTDDPAQRSEELSGLAVQKTGFDHVAVGVWFAKTDKYPSGMYWVVVQPEYGAAHEAFWSHWYLTDTFEYQTIFDKHWRSQLPAQCVAVR